ncbi:MAG: PhzF family phenazine biosynthesis protein, partial [Gammaproteobacteria bacterium]
WSRTSLGLAHRDGTRGIRDYYHSPAGLGTGSDFVSRFFAPDADIPEDTVTSSAHTALAPYWSARLGRTASPGCRLPPYRAGPHRSA